MISGGCRHKNTRYPDIRRASDGNASDSMEDGHTCAPGRVRPARGRREAERVWVSPASELARADTARVRDDVPLR